MFITRKSLSRRTVLRGLGTTLALPFLESMVPAMARADALKPTLRFGAVYVPNGCPMNFWMPKGEAGALQFTPILEPLRPFAAYTNVVNNLSRAGGLTVTDHAVSSAGWLSGAVAKQTEAEDIRVGITIDQVLAKHLGQDTPFPSLEFATEDFSGYIGGCVPGYSCAYMNTISWASETEPLPMEINPRVAFERMFGRAGTAEQRLRRSAENRSILDSVADEARSLSRSVSAPDRTRIEDYMENVREIERRIQKTVARGSTSADAMTAPVGIPESFEEHMRMMFDLLVVAYQADMTRVFTFMTGREASQRTYPGLGMKETHHDTSHHGGNPEKMAQHAKINTLFISLFAEFLDKLRKSPDGQGSLLDHSLIAYGHGMSDGQAHSAYPLAFAAIGGAGGKVRGNRYLKAPEWSPIANLWLGVAGLFGSPIERIGESNARFELV
ncbi:MAG TPA: DUF1552 domain-containing protein [Gammaproteobacteria bacterium]|jgi:hypothetical protein|nr:DUF1552 domain-containing protein [Gammaproteobacteria bacterium]